MDEAGNTVVVWERQSTITHNVQASTRSPGGSFSPPVDLAVQSQDPAVEMTPGGETLAAWWRFSNPPGNYVLQVSTRPPGGGFSSPIDVTGLPVGAIPGSIQLVVNSAGDAAIAWVRRDPASPIDPNVTFVEASVRPAGGAFSTPAVVSPQPLVAAQNATNPDLAIAADGEVAVVWDYDDGTDQVIQASIRPPGGGFALPVPISESGEDAGSPAVAIDSAGNAIATWSRTDGEDLIVQASARPAGGAFSLPATDLSASGAEAFTPEIAMTPAGAATAVWTLVEEGGRTVQASDRPPGGEFSSPQDISVDGEAPLFPDLAMNPGGEALVAWSGASGGDQIARAAVRPSAGASFGAPAPISATGSGLFHPVGAIGPTGDATVAWVRSNGANDIVQAAGYDADPPGLRNVSIPASGTVGVPVGFSAEPFDVWPISSTSFSFGDGAVAEGASVSHVYTAPGAYPVVVTARDAAGTPTSAGGTIEIAPSYEFRIGKQKRNRKRGVTTLTVVVPGPGAVVASGAAVKRVRKRASSAGQVRIPIAAKGKALKQLARKGKARVRVTVAFTPDGGSRSARRTVQVVLIKKR